MVFNVVNMMFTHPQIIIFNSIKSKHDLSFLNFDHDINPCKYLVADKKFDIWSIGIIAFILLYHESPFEGSTRNDLVKNICKRQLKFPSQSTDKTLQDFIFQIFHDD